MNIKRLARYALMALACTVGVGCLIVGMFANLTTQDSTQLLIGSGAVMIMIGVLIAWGLAPERIEVGASGLRIDLRRTRQLPDETVRLSDEDQHRLNRVAGISWRTGSSVQRRRT
jgi:hypothetical protein